MLDYGPFFEYLGVCVVPRNASIYRFGLFELDARTGELRKSGVKLRLQEQPYQVLLRLIERPGEMVSREELRAALWEKETFVDFETGLNTAIKRLREALGDSVNHPAFVETLPRRGYRFIAPVEGRLPSDAGFPAPSRGPEATSGYRLIWRIALVGGALALVLICVAYWRSQPHPPVVSNVVRITNDGKPKNPFNTPVTDGVHLYFTEGMPFTTGSAIAQVSGAGGETTLMPTTQNVLAVSSISPDRSQLLFSKGVTVGSDSVVELWVQPLPAGAPHRVGSINARFATWTPDGSHVVYADGNSIMVANKNGSESHQLAKLPGYVFGIRYSPDGRRIRLDVSDPKTDTNWIWEMDADGKNIHRLLPRWGESPEIVAGYWSPDGKYYYFQAGNGDLQAIWVMPEPGSIFRRPDKGPSRLMSGPLRFSSPVPSGDGKRLFVIGEEPRVELQRYDLRARRFDPYLSGLSAGPIDFSPDRKWVAYVSYPEMTLWVSRVDGRDRMQLTFPPVRAYLPRWSPDGSQIVFQDVRFDSPWKIYSVSPLGGGPELLVQSETYEADPTWTPDGRSIIFGEVDRLGKGAIYSLDWKTREVSLIPDSNGLFSPRMSPDGRYISAITVNNVKLMLFDTKKKLWSDIAESYSLGYNEWSHDGKYLYFRQHRGGAGELARVRMQDRLVEHILSLKDFPQPSDVFAWWSGLTPDDAPLLMRDRSVQEIYALDLEFR